jgi:AcrR family transcriptional regulator
MAESIDPPRARRTGGRSARVRTSVLEATVDVLSEGGFDTLSIRDIAKRAEVHESSIYRRWGTKSNLVSDALLSRAGLEIPTPDTGSLREDLFALISAVAAFISTPLGENFVRMALRQDLSNSDAARDKYWTDRFTRGSVILDRAEDRGELRAGVDRFLTLELLVAPLYLRLLLTNEPLSDNILKRIVDMVMSGIVVECV